MRMIALFGLRAVRLARLAPTFAALESKHPREPHWYLIGLATDPKYQGKGIGSFLMSHVLERIDEEGSAAYLEASSLSNVRFYGRFGFEVQRQFQLPDGQPVWLMLRPKKKEKGSG